MQGALFVISAPSGCGKTTLLEALLKHPPVEGLKRVVTYTTRKQSLGEAQGVDYHFTTEEDFKRKIEQSFFFEWSTTYTAWYGTPKDIMLHVNHGARYIAILDRNGARMIKQAYPASVLIWLYPPSLGELEKRLRLRGRDDESSIVKRLEIARHELHQEESCPLFDHRVLNEDSNEMIKKVEKIISLHCFEQKKYATF